MNDGEGDTLTPMEKYKIKMAWYAIVIGFLLPLVEFITAWLCYKLYKDHESSHDLERANYSQSYSRYDDNYGSAQNRPTPIQPREPGTVQSQHGQSQAARAAEARARENQYFQGQGRRLGDGNDR